MNRAIDKLRGLCENKIVGVIARGGSASILEERIIELKDKDIVWASMNLFTPAEDFILGKINKKLSFVSDCSNVPYKHVFESKVRVPRFINYLQRPNNNLLQISKTVITDLLATNNGSFLEIYKDKIITIDEVFTGPEFPQEVWAAPPNSITLLLAAVIAGCAKKILLFGYDGFNGDNNHTLHTYYKSHLEQEERFLASGKGEVGSLSTDSVDFNKRWPYLERLYKNIYNSQTEIVNCSPGTMFDCIRRINYEQVIGECS